MFPSLPPRNSATLGMRSIFELDDGDMIFPGKEESQSALNDWTRVDDNNPPFFPDEAHYQCWSHVDPEPPSSPSSPGQSSSYVRDCSSSSLSSLGGAQLATDEHVCGVCALRFTNRYLLELHAKETGHRCFACPCPGCDKKYCRRDLLTRHKRSHQDDRYSCGYCGDELHPKKFKRKDHLVQHIRNCHPPSLLPPSALEDGNLGHSKRETNYPVSSLMNRNNSEIAPPWVRIEEPLDLSARDLPAEDQALQQQSLAEEIEQLFEQGDKERARQLLAELCRSRRSETGGGDESKMLESGTTPSRHVERRLLLGMSGRATT